MLRTKAIRKIFLTSLSMFIILCVFTLSTITNDVLRTNLEIHEISGIVTDDIYLLSKNGYLVRKRVLLDYDNDKDKIIKALNYLIDKEENKFSNELIGPIPKGTIVNDVICGDKIVTVDLSKKLMDVSINHEKHMISAIVYTVLNISDAEGVSILVDGSILESYPNTLEKLPSVLDRNIGINKDYNITSREDISRVVIYYLDDIDNELYFVPVTKYLNDSRDKIKIIIEQLSSSYLYEDSLMSFLSSKVELLDYYIENDVLFLNFNEFLFDTNDVVLEEVLYSISYSVFDNYDVSMVMFEVNGKEVNHVFRNENI